MKRNIVVLFFLLLPHISICQGVSAGPSLSNCDGKFMMNATAPSVGETGKWTIVEVIPPHLTSKVIIEDDEDPQTIIWLHSDLIVTLKWTIENPPSPPISAEVTLTRTSLSVTSSIQCFQGKNAIVLDIDGGSGIYSYTLDGGPLQNLASDYTIRDLLPGDYLLAIFDQLNPACIVDPVGQFKIYPPLSANINYSGRDILCFGEQNIKLSLNINGGTPNYEYKLAVGDAWAPVPPDNKITLPVGKQAVWVKDNIGCEIKTDSVLISTFDALIVTVQSVENVICYGNSTGSIKLNILSGNNGYEYSLDNGTTWTALSPDSTIRNLSAGTYNIQIKDQTNCLPYISLMGIVINQPNGLLVNLHSISEVSCYSGSNGSIKLNILSGNGGYEYSLDNMISWLPLAADSTIQGLSQGVYDVYVKDAKDCLPYIHFTNVIINQPQELVVSIHSISEVSCYGSNGSVKLNILSGNGGYEYSFDNGTTWTALSSDSTIHNLPADTYDILIKDRSSCLPFINISATINNPAQLSYNYSVTDVLCSGEGNGSITIEASGGTGAYLYSIDNGQSYSTIKLFNGLQAGNYTILVKDGNGCLSNVQDTVIAEPKPISIKMDIIDNTCKASIVIIETTGGHGDYQYSIDNGGAWRTLGEFMDLAGEQYAVTVKDKNNCQAVFPVTLNMDYSKLTPDVLPDYEANVSYNVQLQTSASSPYTFITSDRLPNGLELTIDGLIKGTPKVQIAYSEFNFTVKLTDKNGCEILKPYVLKSNSDILIPEIITPNGDGKNDYFMKGYRVIIFDRLGMKLFEGKDGWDGTHKGKVVAQDTYFYILFYKGNKMTGSISVFK